MESWLAPEEGSGFGLCLEGVCCCSCCCCSRFFLDDLDSEGEEYSSEKIDTESWVSDSIWFIRWRNSGDVILNMSCKAGMIWCIGGDGIHNNQPLFELWGDNTATMQQWQCGDYSKIVMGRAKVLWALLFWLFRLGLVGDGVAVSAVWMLYRVVREFVTLGNVSNGPNDYRYCAIPFDCGWSRKQTQMALSILYCADWWMIHFDKLYIYISCKICIITLNTILLAIYYIIILLLLYHRCYLCDGWSLICIHETIISCWGW